MLEFDLVSFVAGCSIGAGFTAVFFDHKLQRLREEIDTDA